MKLENDNNKLNELINESKIEIKEKEKKNQQSMKIIIK